MNKFIGFGISLLAAVAPVGLALAHADVEVSAQGNAKGDFVVQNNESNLEFLNAHANVNASTSVNGRGENEGDEHGNATSSERREGERGNATSSERNQGQQGELERGEHSSSSENASDDHPAWGVKGGLVGFLRWIFGLPATTTVGEVRADLSANATTSTTTSPSQGLGFWARILTFFGFGRGED